MRTRQGAVLQSLRRARAFLDTHDAQLGLSGTETRKALDETITHLSEQAVMQDFGARGSRGETARLRASRISLRLYHMRPIAELARLRLRDVPEFASLRMPPSHVKAEQLLAAASAMADAASLYEKVLIENGLVSTFIADLRAALVDFRGAIDGRGEYQRKRSGATAGLVETDRRGRVMLRVLDGLVIGRLRNDQQLVAEWQSARRIRRQAVMPSEVAVLPVPPATPILPPTAPLTQSAA